MRKQLLSVLLSALFVLAFSHPVRVASAVAGPPVYEPAYVNGKTVIISVKDPQLGKVPTEAQNDYFEVIYPNGWEALLFPHVPQCNPCEHGGDGDDFYDYHDHVFGGQPGTGRGAYGALWQLSFVLPLDKTGDPMHDAAVSVAYASHLPVTSAEAVQKLLTATVPDGSPIAERVLVDYHFLAAIVSPKAAR